MITVKVTIPGQPSQPNLSQYTGNDDNIVSGCKFVINDPTLEHADVWMVIDGLDQPEACRVPASRTVFLSVEVLLPLDHYLRNGADNFLSQFSQVHTCFANNHPHSIRDLPFQPWMINANHGSFFLPSERDVNWLSQLENLPKPFEISVICSNLMHSPAHCVRLAFVRALKERLGDRLHWFGNGVNRIDQKWDGISPYKYTIVLENQRADDVITEKLYDSFLAYSCPIYWGAPNACSYFPKESFEDIDITDIKASVLKVERILELNRYKERIPHVRKARNIVLNKCNWLERMACIAEELHGRAPTNNQVFDSAVLNLLPFQSFRSKQPWSTRALNLSRRIYHRLNRS